ncbi:MAG TPA: vWA domain-containing protein [Bryobacteraceae bacterium]|nr:vWA domain-containing protein [Bryobacteraceae bacterium]
MRKRFSNRNRRRRGIATLVTAAFLALMVPLMGLAIDTGIMFAVHSKLSAACDAAALAGARALVIGADETTQETNAKNTATEYMALNFPAGYFGIAGVTGANGAGASTIDSLTIDTSVSHQRAVDIVSEVTVNTIFMRWLGVNNLTMKSEAKAVRRDVNVVLVMDRSGSLSLTGSCEPLKSAAENFVSQFALGRDNIGLVTFATASKMNPADFAPSTSFSSLTTTISSISCSGGTSTALGLYNGYAQLINLGTAKTSGALNVILLFTDGYPTNITAVYPNGNPGSCFNTTGTLVTTFNIGTPSDPSTWHPAGMQGLYTPNTPDSTQISNSSGCGYTGTSSLSYIPNTDLYGSTINSGYQSLTTSSGHITLNYQNLDNGSTNAADSMGLRIRHGASLTSVASPNGTGVSGSLSGVVTYAIGLGNAGGVADDFLERFANDPRASNYDNTYATGLYVEADDTEALNDAFLRIASEILRLAK